MRSVDLAIVGAGILGLATARELLTRHPGLRVAVLDKEHAVAAHQSGHNSGVVHRGVYYLPGSLKARLCVAGAQALESFCQEHGIEFVRCGKLIIARDRSELPALDELHRRAAANGVPDLRRIGPEEISEIEPHALGVAALHSPTTSAVDFSAVATAYAVDVAERGGEILLGNEVRSILPQPSGSVLETTGSDMAARWIISCAGLQSDRVAAMADGKAMRDLRIIPFRGDYYVLRAERAHLCRGMIYPVPDPRYPFLGVHFTRRHDGAVWAGPNAVLALARQGYRKTDLEWRDLVDTFGFSGFWRMAIRNWRTGIAEIWRDVVKRAFIASLRSYVPEITSDDLVPGPSGIRAQAIARDGALVDDFAFTVTANAIHVRNAPSPAATSSLAIAAMIADRAEAAFDLA